MKKCNKCLVEKPLTEFVTSKATKSGYKARCKLCNQQQQHEYFIANRDKRMKQIKINLKNWKQQLKNEIDKLKSKPCKDCGNCFPPCAMDFDHLEGSVKTNNISTMITNRVVSREKIYEEIAKCELVCANCHRVRTHNRLKNGKWRNRVTQSPD